MVKTLKFTLAPFSFMKIIHCSLIIILFFPFFSLIIFTHSPPHTSLENQNEICSIIPSEVASIPINIVFVGYNEEYINFDLINSRLATTTCYHEFDTNKNQPYNSYLQSAITLSYNFHFVSSNFTDALDSFIDKNSWNSTTSALNITQLNLQEETGERLSIFYEQDGRAIDGEAVEQYLVNNKGFDFEGPSYVVYFLNQSRYDSSDHSFEHWFEIDEVDPDSNVTVNWWRLEWDNDFNPEVEYPYPSWGFQNRIFFIDPYSHQWYTKWTNIWWNPDLYENKFNYLTVDLDTYLEGHTPGTSDYNYQLTTYLTDYLNDIITDLGVRGDGLLANEREISAQILYINDEATHGYNQANLEWIFHKEIAEEAFDYVVPSEVASIAFEETWVELDENPTLKGIIDSYTMDSAALGSYPWYRSDWTYLNGISIFYALQSVTNDYFDVDKGDRTLTSWVLLMQNISMVSWSYGEYREFTGLGGEGNVVCFKDLNRYFASDGTTPRSGATTLLIHELGHVLGFKHAEITNDASEGAGGFMRDVMSYYSEGTPYFSVFLKDSLYRTSSYVAYNQNIQAITTYRANPDHNSTYLALIDETITTGLASLEAMNYLEAFLALRQLYELTIDLDSHLLTPKVGVPLAIILLPITCAITLLFDKYHKKRI